MELYLLAGIFGIIFIVAIGLILRELKKSRIANTQHIGGIEDKAQEQGEQLKEQCEQLKEIDSKITILACDTKKLRESLAHKDAVIKKQYELMEKNIGDLNAKIFLLERQINDFEKKNRA